MKCSANIGDGFRFKIGSRILKKGREAKRRAPAPSREHLPTVLKQMDLRAGQVVEMRYFGGMSNPEVAAAIGASLSTVKRDWETAKAWLLCEISQGDSA